MNFVSQCLSLFVASWCTNWCTDFVQSLFPDYEEESSCRGWSMLPDIDRVYVNHRAQEELGWKPRFDFRYLLERLQRGESVFSTLARAVGSKGYHPRSFEDGPYPIW